REAPPAPREEQRRARQGFVFIPGRWEWKTNKWEWLAGRDERERPGKTWREGRWDRKGDAFVYVEGDWTDEPVAAYPREAPPAPREERLRPRAGFVLIPGRWDWRGGKWEWVEARYEAERVGKSWREGRWDRRGDRYVYVEGDWSDEPVATRYPREAPPAPREESQRPRAGYVLIPGRWDWRGGKWEWVEGRYETPRTGKRWRDGRWDRKDDGYTYLEGEWIDDDRPREAPPAPRQQRFDRRAGFEFIPGRWDWRGGRWEWVEGRYEQERRGKRFRDGRWERFGDSWGFVEGDWIAEDEPELIYYELPRGQRLDLPVVGNFWPPKGRSGSRVMIQGRNFSPDAVVLWDGQPIRSRVLSTFEIELRVPANANTGELSLRDPARRRDLQVGLFEVVPDYDAEAEFRRIEAERQRAAQAAIDARRQQFAAARAARELAIRQRVEARAASRAQRRAARIAALRAKWVRDFLRTEDTQFELTLHAQRSADLQRMLEIAELKNDVRLAVRIEVARSREDARHDRRMTTLVGNFKGGNR
ncbi:MAG: YXWGXW repeat-containing protein, partial [Deltaproteobacteria bacterium]|nr:YXWGXW repeat-containing protein [Deltaproteobacteria bacterium]